VRGVREHVDHARRRAPVARLVHEQARVAIGNVKLPRPQNQSITRSDRCMSSSRSARATSTRLMCGLTCVKSVGLNGMRTPNSGSV
jgi:hypothetical protein